LAAQLRVDPGVLPVPHDHLDLVDVVRAPAERRLDRQLESVRETGLREKSLGLRNVLLVVTPPLRAQLIDRDRPLLERGGNRRIRNAMTLGPGIRSSTSFQFMANASARRTRTSLNGSRSSFIIVTPLTSTVKSWVLSVGFR